ncbi:GMC family oxidoreductase N-terminal domain-containing protein [Frankia sp. AgB1.9]|uniref:GMC family oxidoreductase n=1 Tax=unclassified Frankia TaxID=2632575 RepID=UPI0019348BD8|nr:MULTISPECIES: GMC family oxidoreductase N-terminal domain-containing protein [unclassified Frankia]MBL7487666.1 GMC family oxidoreductase N-terminal domain-containing protein [Frankia sp. AgW1.1]MBL7550044.1 GMC family oxidoreductase N-terminal domain-containing protein [Frankia sp. AgB1.9]MBL7621761.1 GMC family oxidoreductase N-terminal domain-containing protein [Frankia sp. AgB1.8]
MSTFTYIVVGAGSAGCAAASRLSEDPGATVLLVEAGGTDQVDTVQVPPAWPANWGSETDWNLHTTAQEGLAGAEVPWARGRVIGGSSSINGMIYLRGHGSNYDRWERGGATGWGYESVLPFFKKMETAAGDPRWRGKSGPLRPAVVAEPNPLTLAYLEAAGATGHKTAPDFNADQHFGANLHELTIVEGRRQSSAAAYLGLAAGRANLTVLSGALVRRLTFDGARCAGVEYEKDGVLGGARAEEVVLSAGAIGSPQLLMLSGVGPAEHLTSLSIPVVADLPGVGENLQDHLLAGVTYEAAEPLPPSVHNHGEASAAFSSGLRGPDVADVQFLFILVPFHPPTLAPVQQGYTVGVALMAPRSRGTIRLRSADPGDAPLIDPRYLSERSDADILVHGLERARDLGGSAALARWRRREAHPGADPARGDLRAYLPQAASTYYHPVGTCRIGLDDLAVVDPLLRVRGVEGLRVADASVMPDVPDANTNAASIMIGERVAAFLSDARGDTGVPARVGVASPGQV